MRLHAARNMPAVISTIMMSGLFVRGVSARQCQRILPTVDTANRPWPTSVAPRRVSSGRVARGPVAPRKMACRPLAGKASISGSRLSTRARGAACSLPLSNLWQVETMTVIQLLKIAIGLAFGAYFVWWSLQVLDRLTPEYDEPAAAMIRPRN